MCIDGAAAHILVYNAIIREAVGMSEEERQVDEKIAKSGRDVDDYIFKSEPQRPVSDR